tara:strand:+ start:1135 stop:1398 length:264 start_codon:yes stop_codon:yes gene_type:complete
LREPLCHGNAPCNAKACKEAFVKLTLNGEIHTLPDNLTITGLIAHLGLPNKKIAVERNLEVVPKSTFGDVKLTEGDRLEIIHFIGGG